MKDTNYILIHHVDTVFESCDKFITMEEVYNFIVENRLIIGTYQLYKAERVISENL